MIETHELINGRSIKVLNRAPNDEFTFSLFAELLESLDCDFEAYHGWPNPPDNIERLLKFKQFSKPNVVIGIKDLIDFKPDYNYWRNPVLHGIKLLDNAALRNPDKNFVFFTSLENIHKEPWTAANIQFVCWGGDISNQASQYATLEPVLDKNFDSPTAFISLNRGRRDHRLVCLSYLVGQGYDQYGHLTLLGQHQDQSGIDNLLHWISWVFEERHSSARQSMINGYKKIYNNKKLFEEDFEIYPHSRNDNITNFNTKIRPLYRNSFVEIVSETTFGPPSFLITEKTAHAIYGCNFPIMMSGAGAVAYLREIGIDVFDDIVDHSYDLTVNPVDRIIAAVDRNQRLLTDVDYAKDQWRRNQHRFESNVKILQTKLFDWFKVRAQQQFKDVIWL